MPRGLHPHKCAKKQKDDNLDCPTTIIKIDDEGDLHLRVGTNCCTKSFDERDKGASKMVEFVVDSRAMIRNSEVFRAMLDGGFAESKKPTPESGAAQWIVTLPEDHIEPFFRILPAIHGRFQHWEIPFRPTVEELYELAVVTDKYDMVHTMKPWGRKLEKHLHRITQGELEAGWSSTIEMVIWICFSFGFSYVFCELIHKVVLSATVDVDGALIVNLGEGPVLPQYPYQGKVEVLEPPDLMDNLLFKRNELLDYAIQILTNLTQHADDITPAGEKAKQKADSHRDFKRFLTKMYRTWPPSEEVRTVIRFDYLLKQLKRYGEETQDANMRQRVDTECSILMIRQQLYPHNWPVRLGVERHLEAQGRLSGATRL